jgi:hypothetical protein
VAARCPPPPHCQGSLTVYQHQTIHTPPGSKSGLRPRDTRASASAPANR